MSWLYLPASTPTFHNAKSKYDLTWWNENSFFQYPAVLISAFYGMKEELSSYPEIVFGDSGGFQNVTQNANLNPVDVLRWQEKVCTHGLILDVPPYDFTGTAQFGGTAAKLFRKSLDQTAKNAREMMNHRERKDLKMYGVIQGETQPQREEWYKTVAETSSEYFGWALSPKPSYDPYKIASYLLTAYEHGLKNIHVLQVSGVKTVSVIFEFLRQIDDKDWFVTFDSSTPLTQAVKNHLYDVDGSITKAVRINLDSIPNTQLCSCPVCSSSTYEEMAQSTGEASRLIGLHNLLHRIHTLNALDYIFRKDEGTYEKLVSSLLKDIPKFIEYGLKNGVTEAISAYHSRVNPGQENIQANLLRGW